MANGSTIFITYVLIPTGNTIGESYTQAVHCNYFKALQVPQGDDPFITEVNFNFPNINDFKFLSDDITNSTGYTVNKIQAIIQLVDNLPFDTIDDVVPNSGLWKYVDITNQISGYTGVLTPTNMVSQVFKISLYGYADFPTYDVSYLNYPSKETTDEDALCLGSEIYFFGNVTTEIKAIAYTTDLSINLPLNEFNSSSNLTWDQNVSGSVTITEIGIYDANKNLVGIGKLNNPIQKDESIARTIIFAIDF